jgi:hypothetical protein
VRLVFCRLCACREGREPPLVGMDPDWHRAAVVQVRFVVPRRMRAHVLRATRALAKRSRTRPALQATLGGSRIVHVCAGTLLVVLELTAALAFVEKLRPSLRLQVHAVSQADSPMSHELHRAESTGLTPLPHLHRDWACPCHIMHKAAGSALPYLRRGWAHPCHNRALPCRMSRMIQKVR